jgi:hypothetical protein
MTTDISGLGPWYLAKAKALSVGSPMHTSNRSDFLHCSRTVSVTDSNRRVRTRTTVVWQGSAGDRRPYADRCRLSYPKGKDRTSQCFVGGDPKISKVPIDFQFSGLTGWGPPAGTRTVLVSKVYRLWLQ